ncbi:MAG: arginine repressor [Actinobacteria bacterium]|jgi:transcriptional regulator of arginine metabolism|nr:arginine repressor [Actinomycetota bacterium]
MSTKQQRQQIITRLIAQENVCSQPHLQEMLKDQGIEATQATISRDLEELGAVKIRVAGGDSIYAIAEYAPARVAPSDQLRRVMAEWVAEVTSSGNLVVVRTPPGCAHVVASALDRSALSGLLGTVAGDDTIFCVAAEDIGGAGLAEELRSLSGVTDATGGIPRKKGTSHV